MMVFVAALVLNAGDKRMSALTLSVGAVVFLPIDPEALGVAWWPAVIVLDLALGVLALAIRARASGVVALLAAQLVLCHQLANSVLSPVGYIDPYSFAVQLLEMLQLVACGLLSRQCAKGIVSALQYFDRKVPPCQRRIFR